MAWLLMSGMCGIRPPFQGLVVFMGCIPRALPWAGLDRPLGADESRTLAALRDALLGADESRTLAALRDALLPKLLSGELRVSELQD